MRTFDEVLQAAMNEAAMPPPSGASSTGWVENDFVAQVAAAAAKAELVVSKPRPPVWAEVLCVSLPCSEQSVKQAFRQRAFETHPDRPGGSHEAFLSAHAAYERGLEAVRAGRGMARLAPSVAPVSSYPRHAEPARRSTNVAVA